MKMKYELKLIGITYNQVESGVYAIILQEKDGTRRIPIIVGSAEAQSIECKLQEIITPRPLTHDLFVNVMRAFGLGLREVLIRRLPLGVFAADLVLTDGSRELRIDSRSSDAIALAVRTGSPIYTTLEVLEEAGFDQSVTVAPIADAEPDTEGAKNASRLSKMSDAELSDALDNAVASENYEGAKAIKDELDRRASM